MHVATRSEDGRAVVTVANTGAEIRPEELSRLFDPFRRLERDRTRSGRGAGLGLSIVRAVVDAHGGELRAAPRTGGGLEVEVRLPTTPAAQDMGAA